MKPRKSVSVSRCTKLSAMCAQTISALQYYWKRSLNAVLRSKSWWLHRRCQYMVKELTNVTNAESPFLSFVRVSNLNRDVGNWSVKLVVSNCVPVQPGKINHCFRLQSMQLQNKIRNNSAWQ